MTTPKPNNWLSVHLFYNEPWEEFLNKAVGPYVNTALQTGIAQQFFFIRYWEQGPHIRLRLKGNPEMVQSVLQPNLQEHFNNYFESKPSRRTEPGYPPNFPENLKWLPNNSIHYKDYEREEQRYGGSTALLLGEEQFMLSSMTILDFIKSKGKSWSYEDAMGTAIQLHISFAYALGFNFEETIHFFDFIYKNWMPFALKKYHNQVSPEEYQLQSQRSIQSFEKAFDSQKKLLLPFLSQFLENLQNGEAFEEKAINNWVSENNRISAGIQYLHKVEKLEPRPTSIQYKIPPVGEDISLLLWSIYADFIHMTNNRLGILNRDEPYIGYLIMKSLKTAQGKRTVKS